MTLFPKLPPSALSNPGFCPGAALVCAQAAELSYQGARTIEAVARLSQAANFQFIECRQTDTQCFVAGDAQTVLAAFRGTSDWRDLLTDCRIGRAPCGSAGRVHRGCQSALQSVLGEVAGAVARFCDNGQALFITGHSLGGALAALAAAQNWPGLAGVYTFGSPRVGDRAFAAHYDALCGGRSWRVVNNADPIPWLPGPLIGYRHVGTEIFVEAGGAVLVGPPWGQKLPVLAREAWAHLRAGGRAEAIFNALRLAEEVPACHPIRRYVALLESLCAVALVPEGQSTIAQRFNAGLECPTPSRPEGTIEIPAGRPFLTTDTLTERGGMTPDLNGRAQAPIEGMSPSRAQPQPISTQPSTHQ